MKKYKNDHNDNHDDDDNNNKSDKPNKFERMFLDYFENLIIRVIDDSLIENILLQFIITDNENMHENDKQMIKILIENDKKIHFLRIRYLFLVVFSMAFGFFIDNIKDKYIFRISISGLIYYSRPSFAKVYRKYEKKTMIELETTTLNLFNKKIKYVITKNIEKNIIYENDDVNDDENDDHDHVKMNVQHIYLECYKNVLLIFRYYTVLLKEICECISNIILFFIMPFVFKTNNGFKKHIFNTIFGCAVIKYSFNFFTSNIRWSGIKKNKEEYKIKNNILTFFKNMNIIIENNTIENELNSLIDQISKLINNNNFLQKYILNITAKEFSDSIKYFKLSSTFFALIINEPLLISSLSIIKSRIVLYASAKNMFNQNLHIIHDFIDIINEKPYQISKTIPWANNYETNLNKNIFVLENITLEYENKDGTKNKVLQNISLKFDLGKLHFLYGNSGCGKTTLLNALMKRVKIAKGVIKFLGIYDEYTYFNIRKYLTYMTSESALFSKDLYYNITYGINKKILKEKQKEKEVTETIIKYITLFCLDKFIPTMKTTNATKLSKGQTQRVAIIRLFIDIIFNDTRILFLDEFTSNIDNKMEEIIFTELITLQKKYNLTIFYVSHNLYNMKYSDYNFEIDTETHSIQKNITNVT